MNEIERSSEKPLSETKVNLPVKGPEALSDKPSILIRQAMDDLERVERTPGYKVDMGIWHETLGGQECFVCMAGSVIAGTLGAERGKESAPHKYGDKLGTSRKLYALNQFRAGLVPWAVSEMCGTEFRDDPRLSSIQEKGRDRYTPYPNMSFFTDKEETMADPEWQYRRKRFGDYMHYVADELEKIGL